MSVVGVDIISLLQSAYSLVQMVNEWKASQKIIPAQLEELRVIASTIHSTVGRIRNLKDERLADMCKFIEDELGMAHRLVAKLKQKQKKWFFNPKGVLAEISGLIQGLKEHHELLCKCLEATKVIPFDADKIIKNEDARIFWAKNIGANFVVVEFQVFLNAIRAVYNIPETKLSHARKSTMKKLDVHAFSLVTEQKGMDGLVQMVEFGNPFEITGTDKDEDHPDAAAGYETRNVVWTPPASRANPEHKYFYIFSEAGGCIAVQDDSNQPGASLCVGPIRNSTSQKWKFDKYGCIRNMLSGLVIDVDKQPTTMVKLIQWPAHGGGNQRWRES